MKLSTLKILYVLAFLMLFSFLSKQGRTKNSTTRFTSGKKGESTNKDSFWSRLLFRLPLSSGFTIRILTKLNRPFEENGAGGVNGKMTLFIKSIRVSIRMSVMLRVERKNIHDSREKRRSIVDHCRGRKSATSRWDNCSSVDHDRYVGSGKSAPCE
jgi:hypothetical protein